MLKTRKQHVNVKKRDDYSVMVDSTTKQYIVSLSRARGLPQKWFMKELMEKIAQQNKMEVTA